uniref:Bifunctional inhibitor/plant lipid transfer protein/seed storage helical domain-containing protein n=1 Tax=Chenopodium quinoa TaxID=63459 RepID=A0A803L6G8_CHEQI
MSKVLCLAALMVVLAVSTPLAAQAQNGADLPDCVTKLNPCGPFINSTTVVPPATCCKPLEVVLKNDIPCLCNIFSSIELIQTLSLNVTEALTLPQRCDLQFDIIAKCEDLAQAPSPSSSPAAGSTPTPPGSASTSSPPGNAAPKITGAGSVGIVSILLMFGAYTMF